jgi:hypothetical protein
MLINNQAANTKKLNIFKKLMLVMTVSALPFTQVTAGELTVTQHSVSKGEFKKNLNEQKRKSIIDQSKLAEFPDQLKGTASGKTRSEIIKNPNKSLQITTRNNTSINSSFDNNSSNSTSNKSSDYFADFDIYSASTFLQDDFDGDGYYQTFSVTFDADIYSYTDNLYGEVYALLYISKNGGPWTHYFTTDNFLIQGDSDLDEYEVISTMLSGYESDHYDVLIDLYQVGYSDIVASLSSQDNNALYALPIESADYDEPYVEVVEVVEVHSGSMYWLVLVLVNIFLFRRYSANN